MNQLKITLLATSFLLAAGSANAAPITILNPGFEDSTGTGTRGNLTTLLDWTEENASQVFVDNNGTTWVPEPSRTLYLNAINAGVNQDLSHNWATSDVFTLGLIAMNPSWDATGNIFKVQLRQASDDTVLWDSGTLDVSGTVTTTSPATYTGTGHIFNWTIHASTFTTGTSGEQINIRILNLSNNPVYADNVSLDVVPEPTSLALLGLGGLLIARRRSV